MDSKRSRISEKLEMISKLNPSVAVAAVRNLRLSRIHAVETGVRMNSCRPIGGCRGACLPAGRWLVHARIRWRNRAPASDPPAGRQAPLHLTASLRLSERAGIQTAAAETWSLNPKILHRGSRAVTRPRRASQRDQSSGHRGRSAAQPQPNSNFNPLNRR